MTVRRAIEEAIAETRDLEPAEAARRRAGGALRTFLRLSRRPAAVLLTVPERGTTIRTKD
jgi:hypothetical protein